MSQLKAISPIDGRYASRTEPLQEVFSEYALIKYRFIFEVRYFNYIIKLLDLSPFKFTHTFTETDAQNIKYLEKTTNHDVKAVELYLKSLLPTELEHLSNYVHFGLTSQDVNTTVYTLQLKIFTQHHYIPLLNKILKFTLPPIPMLSRTHGQPATPTTFQQQTLIFVTRLIEQINQLKTYHYRTKLGGATGDLNAHKCAYPKHDWDRLLTVFLNDEFGFTRLYPTTQISHYDDYAEYFSIVQRINTILIDLCKDIWHYISINYLIQIPNSTETGSSTMPHKVNPIDFENAEGNLQISNTLLQFFQTKLPVSRLQRDLTDSTVLRNVGTAFGHSYLAITSIRRGLNKIAPNETQILKDLNDHPEILAEAYQTTLRTLQPPLKTDPYQLFKDFTRGNPDITMETLHKFLDTLKDEVPSKVLSKLKKLTPASYALATSPAPAFSSST